MTDGRLVLVFDDGYVKDHEQVAPVLDAKDVPAVVAVVRDRLGGEA
jgi:peptidoglycan/xylan/chitin deacetylase (PgdA/CDA1 family)